MNDLEQAAREIFKTKPVLIVKQNKNDGAILPENKADHFSTEEKQGA